MTKQIFIMGLLIGLSGIFGCNNKADNKKSQQDSSSTQKIDLTDALFTTPTIENALPEFKEKTDSCAFFHEDNWRQIEFISKDQKSAIEKEFAKIKDIYDNYSHKSKTYTAYKQVAVRDLITQPLTVDFTKLKSYLTGKEIKMQGLGLENNSGQVKNGFFFNADGVNYYGLLDNNKVKTFCIYSADNNERLKSATIKLSKFVEEEKLYLVDWRAMKMYDEITIKTDL